MGKYICFFFFLLSLCVVNVSAQEVVGLPLPQKPSLSVKIVEYSSSPSFGELGSISWEIEGGLEVRSQYFFYSLDGNPSHVAFTFGLHPDVRSFSFPTFVLPPTCFIGISVTAKNVPNPGQEEQINVFAQDVVPIKILPSIQNAYEDFQTGQAGKLFITGDGLKGFSGFAGSGDPYETQVFINRTLIPSNNVIFVSNNLIIVDTTTLPISTPFYNVSLTINGVSSAILLLFSDGQP